MTTYNIEYSYKIEEFGATIVEADDSEQAMQFGREYVLETYPEICDLTIDTVKEV